MIERIEHRGEFLALILRANFREPGVHFVTENHLSQQLAFMRHPQGQVIAPHVHNEVHREVTVTQEVLLIQRGLLRVDFYSVDKDYLFSRTLRAGDTILLIRGGHGFKVLEEVEMVEVKQGPYAGEGDKTRFSPIAEDQVHE